MSVLFVVDVEGWAFDITVDNLMKNLPINVAKTYIAKGPKYFSMNMIKDYTHVHFMNWLDGAHRTTNSSGGVCSHNFEIRHNQLYNEKIGKFKSVCAISRRLYDHVLKSNPNTFYCPNGVDTEMFMPVENKKEFTVGFVGQETTGGLGKGTTKLDIKGYHLILLPLMKRLESKVKFKILSNNFKNAIPHKEMPKWYEDIDSLICTSLYEGCPFPALEAAACGKSIISTDVGILSDLINKECLIHPPRKDEDIPNIINFFEEKILFLKSNREESIRLGIENRVEAEENWNWSKVSTYWLKMFKHLGVV